MKQNKERKILISGYGPGDGGQPSVALYGLSDKTDAAMEVWSDTVAAPSYLCTYQDICFAIREEEKDGSVLLYRRDGDTYLLQDELFLKGGGLCHIVYQPTNETLYCSFYATGHIAAVQVKDYHFTKVVSFFQIKPEDGESLTRVHCCTLEPDGSRVLASNIALDRIYLYHSEEGVLVPNTGYEYIQLERGIGPRHLKFHPIQNYLYLITEYSNEILTFLYKVEDDVPQLLLLQRISTLPGGYAGDSTGSAVDISKDGRFLYAANRGADTIAVFEIDTEGILHKIQDASCLGRCPRHIALTKDDAVLMAANQESNEAVMFHIDDNTGKLLEVASRIPFYKPTYLEEV